MPVKHKILVVDDDADFAEALSSFLEANGYQVLQARNGAEGLRLAKTQQPDLILMDIVMSERTEGFFTIQEIRHTPGLEKIPVFVVSSIYSQVPGFRVMPEASWLAHDDFLAKPIDPPQLLEKIRARLAQGTAKEVAS
ncbi:MAG TPA: response regulator [Bryobacteraceae bacterium]|nr:response regulator [Bryobacteraceae bacterium]